MRQFSVSFSRRGGIRSGVLQRLVHSGASSRLQKHTLYGKEENLLGSLRILGILRILGKRFPKQGTFEHAAFHAPHLSLGLLAPALFLSTLSILRTRETKWPDFCQKPSMRQFFRSSRLFFCISQSFQAMHRNSHYYYNYMIIRKINWWALRDSNP